MSLISLIQRNNIDGVRDYDNTVNEINEEDDFGNTALIYASKKNNIKIVKLLLEVETIDVNIENNIGQTALIFVARNNYIEIIKLLLENKTINVNLQNRDGDTALIMASSNNNIEVVELLLNIEDINVNLQDINGYTALIFASELYNIEIIKLLLNKGAIVPVKYHYSDDINNVLTNWKTYLPRPTNIIPKSLMKLQYNGY